MFDNLDLSNRNEWVDEWVEDVLFYYNDLYSDEEYNEYILTRENDTDYQPAVDLDEIPF